MKNRFITKAQYGTSGIRPLTPEDVEQLIYKRQLNEANREPTWADYAYKGFNYALNPMSAVSDWIQTQDWAPQWLKESVPYVSTAMSFIGGKPKRPNRGFDNRNSYLKENGMNQTGNSPRFDQRQRSQSILREGKPVEQLPIEKINEQNRQIQFAKKKLQELDNKSAKGEPVSVYEQVYWQNVIKSANDLIKLYKSKK